MPASRSPAPEAPDAVPAAPSPLCCELVLRLPLRLLRYRQRLEEHGSLEGPESIEGPGFPQDHVLHSTTSF